ncbi:MAG: Helix-turn-helix type 11 domain protein [Rhizorhabdus sp.]|nr:Helix-turn-helix type 11 domain protein [Rhizorhabdus sp.]
MIWPVTIGYLDAIRMLIGWCELRQDFRSFRTDRITGAEFLDERHDERLGTLRARWQKHMAARREAERG